MKNNKERKSKSKEQDLNYLIIKDTHGKRTFSKIVYSRVVLTALMVLLQLLLIVFFILKLQAYIEYYFIFSIVLSVSFMMYLTNKTGRNEFKIAWFIPLMIFPIVGVVFYILYQRDTGEKIARNALQKSKEETAEINGPFSAEKLIKNNYDGIKDLQTYFINQSYVPYENCQIDYIPTGEEFFYDFLSSLKKAKKFIFIETFVLKVDESWDLILEVLTQKASEGVEVRVMYDAFGSKLASGSRYAKYLASRNIKICVFNPMIPVFTTRQNSRDHRKIYIIDGEICYTGGLNLANEYFNIGKNHFSYWKDNAVKVQGAAIRTFTTMFLQTWNIQNNKIPEDYGKYLNLSYKKFETPGLIIPYGDDAYNNEDIAENVYLYIANAARNYLHITTPYILLDNHFQEDLIFAAKRGIDVKIIVPSVPDHFITFYIGRTFIKTLLENGVKVYLYKNGENGFIHAKTFISDDKIATVGSINLDYRSFYQHFECGAFIYDSPLISQIEEDFQNTLKNCDEMTIEDYKKIPLIKRQIGRIFRIFAPLM